MEWSKADQIWNRAALEAGGANPFEGDRALADLLFFHGLTMNGGLGHGFDVATIEQQIAAIEGFRYFGFIELALFLTQTADLPEEVQEDLTSEYWKCVPTDQVLSDRFEKYYLLDPEDFGPIGPNHR